MPQWLAEYIKSQLNGGFYGTIVLSCEAGKVVNVKVERNFKPRDLGA